MGYEHLLLERRGAIALLTINRPERLNAMSWEGWLELGRAAVEVSRDEECHVLLLTGAGRGFCAGADLIASQEAPVASGDFPPYAFLSVLVTSAKPTIAAINGMALGGGLALALLCDIRIASERARLAALWIRRGANADFACTYLLPQIIGPPKALEMMCTGDVIGAQEALELGLVNRVVPHEELMPTALALAEKLAKGPPLALGYTKRLAYQATAPRLLGHMTLEGELEQLCLASEDYQEGVRSFMEKRTPMFRGR